MTKKPKLWSKKYILICIVYFLTFCIVHIGASPFSQYVEFLGRSTTASGVLTAVFSIVACVVRPFAGFLCDKIHRAKVVVLGGMVVVVTSVGLRFFSAFGLVLLFRGLQGAGFSIACTAIIALVADVIPKERFGEGMGYFALGGALAMALGPMTGLKVISLGGYNIFFWTLCLDGILVVLTGTLCYFWTKDNIGHIKPEESDKPVGLVKRFIEVKAMSGAVLILTYTVATCGVITFASVYFSKFEYADASLFFLITAASMIAIRLVSGKIFDKFGATVAVIPGIIAAGGMLVALLFMNGVVTFVLISILHGVSWGIMAPALNTVAFLNVKSERRGAASATYNLFSDAGQAGGNVLWGAIISALGYKNMFFVALAFTVIVLAPMTLILLRKKR